MKKSSSTRSPSPAQEKSKDCLSKAADENVFSASVGFSNSDLGKGDRPSKSPSASFQNFLGDQIIKKNVLDPDIISRHGIRECRVVLDSLDITSGAAKLNEHKPCRNKNHLTSQFSSSDKSFLNKQDVKQPIKWPPLSDKSSWRDFEKDVLPLLPSFGSISKRLQCLEDSIYTIGSSRFGIVSSGRPSPSKNFKPTKLCINLVCQKNSLLQSIEDCSCPEERSSLVALLSQVRERLRKVHKLLRVRMRKAKKSIPGR